MASVSVYNIGSTSFSVKLTGLQDVAYRRSCYWVAYDLTLGGNSTTGGTITIAAHKSEGGNYTFTGMSPGHEYQVNCRVENADTGDYLTSLASNNFSTTGSSGGDGGDGGDTPTEWTSPRYNLSYPDGTQVFTIYVGLMECYCIRLLFANTGKFTISSNTAPTGNKFSVYFGTTSGFDSTTGKPRDYDAWLSNNYSFEKTLTYNDTSQYMYVWIAPSRATDIIGNLTITVEPPEATTPTYFQWSSAVAQGLPVKNVSHTEWDSFIDKIKEVLTAKSIINQPLTTAKYGYAVGTTLKTMLNDCYLTYDTELQGYPLTAKKFNVARFIIGSYAPGGSGIAEDKVSETSKVLASDFIKLENSLKAWQG